MSTWKLYSMQISFWINIRKRSAQTNERTWEKGEYDAGQFSGDSCWLFCLLMRFAGVQVFLAHFTCMLLTKHTTAKTTLDKEERRKQQSKHNHLFLCLILCICVYVFVPSERDDIRYKPITKCLLLLSFWIDTTFHESTTLRTLGLNGRNKNE